MAVYDLSKKDLKTGGCEKQPIIKSDIKTGKHSDPVWQVRWKASENNAQTFLSISSDGAMMEWRLTTNELQARPALLVLGSWDTFKGPPRLE